MRYQVQVLGRVINESGDAVSGAKIVAVSGCHFQRQPIDVEFSEGNGLYGNAHFAVADAEGQFEIAGTLHPGRVLSISALAEGYAPLRLSNERLAREMPHDLGDLVVRKGHAIAGTVVDESGEPLADVRVLMALDRGVPGCLQSYPGRGIPLTSTDSEGRFTAAGLLPGRWLFLFDKPGYRVAEAQGNLFNEPSPDELRITLGRGRSVSGRVTHVPDTLEGSLMVEARPIRNGVDYCKQFPSRARPRRALVQADGSFRIEGLNEDAFVPKIRTGVMHGYHPEWTVDEGTLDVWLVVGLTVEANRRLIELPEFRSCRIEAGTTDVELPWLGRASLSARVINEDGNPVEGVHAQVMYESGFGTEADPHQPTILPGGRIELRDYAFWGGHLQFWMPPQRLYLSIRATGYQPCKVEVQDHLRRGEHIDFGDIVLTELPAIHIRVVDQAGNPISHARVYQAPRKQSGWLAENAWKGAVEPDVAPWRYAETNREGEACLPSEDAQILAVFHPDHALHLQQIDAEDPAATKPLEITLRETCRLIVTVRDVSGRPAAYRPVFAEAVDASDKPLSNSVRLNAETDADGRVVFDRLNGRFQVGLKHPEERWRPESHRADSERSIVEVTRVETDASLVAWELHEFTIKIRESDRPVIGGKLKLMSAYLCTQDGEYYDTAYQGFTNDQGLYRFRDIPAGDYVLHLKHDDRNMVNRLATRVTGDMPSIDWLLDNNSITGRLVDSDGDGIAYKRVGIKTDIAGYCQRNNDGITYENGRGGLDWFWSNQAVHETWTDADGSFHLRGLVAGLPIALYTRHGELAETELELQPLHPGEQRAGIEFPAEFSGKKGWRGRVGSS